MSRYAAGIYCGNGTGNVVALLGPYNAEDLIEELHFAMCGSDALEGPFGAVALGVYLVRNPPVNVTEAQAGQGVAAAQVSDTGVPSSARVLYCGLGQSIVLPLGIVPDGWAYIAVTVQSEQPETSFFGSVTARLRRNRSRRG